jgi:hypothetical protein
VPAKLFDKWREADAAARAAEKEVLTASLDALDGKRGPPSLEERNHAKRLRAAADGMLHAAMGSLRTAAKRANTGDREGPESRPWS